MVASPGQPGPGEALDSSRNVTLVRSVAQKRFLHNQRLTLQSTPILAGFVSGLNALNT